VFPKDAAADILAAIVESSDDAIIAKDLHGTVLAWNRGAERMYGYTATEIIGKPISVLIPPDQPNELIDIMARLARGERVEHYETVRVTKDGRHLDVSLSISPVKDAAGRVVGASTIARDITATKQDIRRLRESEARLRSIVEAAVDGIIVIDAHGTVEAFNRGAERLFGYEASEILGRTAKSTTATSTATSARARPASSASAARFPGGARTARRSPYTFRSARCRFAASESSPAFFTI
jgi:two-component system sensor kinase FixL